MPAPEFFLRQILSPILRPLTRLVVGLIAIPMLRLLRTKLVRDREWDSEFEKDIEQWFKASALLLFSTKNMEVVIGQFFSFHFNEELTWYIAAGRIMLAVGVIETMPDQQLFTIIHPGPPDLTWNRKLSIWTNLRPQMGPYLRGLFCQHLNRSSPVFAIMATIFDGWVGWTCYGLCIAQYLFIGLATSRSQALDVLSEFDRQVARRRAEIMDEFYPAKNEAQTDVPADGSASSEGVTPAVVEQTTGPPPA